MSIAKCDRCGNVNAVVKVEKYCVCLECAIRVRQLLAKIRKNQK